MERNPKSSSLQLNKGVRCDLSRPEEVKDPNNTFRSHDPDLGDAAVLHRGDHGGHPGRHKVRELGGLLCTVEDGLQSKRKRSAARNQELSIGRRKRREKTIVCRHERPFASVRKRTPSWAVHVSEESQWLSFPSSVLTVCLFSLICCRVRNRAGNQLPICRERRGHKDIPPS